MPAARLMSVPAVVVVEVIATLPVEVRVLLMVSVVPNSVTPLAEVAESMETAPELECRVSEPV